MKTTFIDLNADEVAALRDSDWGIEEIGKLGARGQQISFPWLRATVGRDRSVWNQLGRGRSVLTSTEQLDQYLYSYGPMISCQWDALLNGMSPPGEPLRLIDYGCGQGLAGLMMFDKFDGAFSSKLAKVVLVEPSSMALVRAEAVYRCIAPSSEIVCVRKGFDQLCTADVMPDEALRAVHVFSNVLDVKGFDQYRLFGQILTPGSHTVMAVSHNRDHDGGTARIKNIKAALEDPKHADQLVVESSTLSEFNCGPESKYSAISWSARLKVSND